MKINEFARAITITFNRHLNFMWVRFCYYFYRRKRKRSKEYIHRNIHIKQQQQIFIMHRNMKVGLGKSVNKLFHHFVLWLFVFYSLYFLSRVYFCFGSLSIVLNFVWFFFWKKCNFALFLVWFISHQQHFDFERIRVDAPHEKKSFFFLFKLWYKTKNSLQKNVGTTKFSKIPCKPCVQYLLNSFVLRRYRYRSNETENCVSLACCLCLELTEKREWKKKSKRHILCYERKWWKWKVERKLLNKCVDACLRNQRCDFHRKLRVQSFVIRHGMSFFLIFLFFSFFFLSLSKQNETDFVFSWSSVVFVVFDSFGSYVIYWCVQSYRQVPIPTVI